LASRRPTRRSTGAPNGGAVGFPSRFARRRPVNGIPFGPTGIIKVGKGSVVIRRFIVAVAAICATFACLMTAARTPEVARIGFVWIAEPSDIPQAVKGFWERLRTLGWEEGRNLVVERRSAEGRIDRFPALVSDVVSRKVDVIVTASTPAAIAARNVTRSVPIVAGGMGDPVGAGLAASLARPGGNLTGLSYGFSDGFAGKWLELLRECAPQLKTIALVYNPQNSWAVHQRKDLETTIAPLGLKIHLVEITSPESLKSGFSQLSRQAQGIIIVADPLTYQMRREISALAIRQRIPIVASMLEFVDAGALLSYGVDNAAVFRRMAEYVDKVLRGAKPEDLPIEQPTELMLAVNLKTAAVIGASVPTHVLDRADMVIR